MKRIHSLALGAVIIALPALASAKTLTSALPAPKPAATPQRALPVKLDPVVAQLTRDKARMAYLQGQWAAKLGRLSEALTRLRRAYRLERHPAILFELARHAARSGDRAAALRYHRHYVARFKDPARRLVAAARFGELVEPRPTEAAKTAPALMASASAAKRQ